MDTEIKRLGAQDLSLFQALIRVFEDVFEMENFRMPPEDHLQQLLEQDGFMVFVALSGPQVVGGLTAYTLVQYYATAPLVYIYDLAVKTEFQRRGIGRQLIREINAYCGLIGVEEVFVQADEVDDHALEFYRSTGATGEKVVHFYYPLTNG